MKVHFIGIGGIGVSAIAQYYLQKGDQVSGSDLAASEITDALAKKGVQIFIGNKPENIQQNIDRVIYSPAVKKDNPEMLQALSFKLQVLSYPEALGELTRQYDTIAISGSHGKSTTTAMTALVLIKAGIDPTVIVGTKLREFASSASSLGEGGATNFRMGKSKWLVIEACEYDGSFINYFPKIAVITNVDKEHLDYFKTFANVVKTFKEFIKKLPIDGFLVANKDDQGMAKVKYQTSKPQFKIQTYSLKQPEAKKIAKIMQIPGKHNVSNALAALAVARILKIKDAVTFEALSEFKGSWRRFDVKEGIANGKKITVVSDYAHHPNEIKATLQAAREKYPQKKIWCIFQPHQYQRTYYLFNDFVKVLRAAKIDQIIITDIYDVAGREEKNISQEVSSQSLVKKINRKHIQYMSMSEAENFVKENIKNGEVLIIMGAGDIYQLVNKF